MGNKKGYGLAAIADEWWDRSHDWSAAMPGYRLLGRTGWDGDEEELPFMRESSRDAWSSAWGRVTSQLRTFCRQLEEASSLHTLVLMEDVNHSVIC